MKPNERGALPILVAIIVLLLIAVIGVAIYNAGRSQKSETAKVSPSQSPAVTPTPTPTPAPGSEEALVAAAVEAACKASSGQTAGDSKMTITVKGDAAAVNVYCAGSLNGHHDYLKKISGVWTVIYSGQEPPGKDIGTKYALPADWYDPNRP